MMLGNMLLGTGLGQLWAMNGMSTCPTYLSILGQAWNSGRSIGRKATNSYTRILEEVDPVKKSYLAAR